MIGEVLFPALLHSLWQGALVALAAVGASRLVTDPASRHRIFGLAILTILFLVPITAIRITAQGPTSVIVSVPPSAQSAIVAVWAIGVAIGAARLVRGMHQPRLMARKATAASRAIQKVADDLARRFGLAPVIPVLIGSDLHSPTVFGWLKPIVLIPGSILTKLSPAEVEALIAHEIAHIARRDYLWLLLQSVAESILFFNPAIWLLSGLMREERELATDDRAAEVLGSKLRVARALVELEHLRLQPTWSPAGVGGSISMRIRRQLGMPTIVHQAWKMWSIGLAILGGMAFAFSPSPSKPAKAAALPTWEQKVITIRMETPEGEVHLDSLRSRSRMLILRSDGQDQVLEIAPL